MRIIGIIAATLTTIAFFPQVIQVIKSKDTKSISLTMYILFVTGVLLWV
ncbi:PQ-loop domain-containing transporter, partial [Cetobacterium sp.]